VLTSRIKHSSDSRPLIQMSCTPAVRSSAVFTAVCDTGFDLTDTMSCHALRSVRLESGVAKAVQRAAASSGYADMPLLCDGAKSSLSGARLLISASPQFTQSTVSEFPPQNFRDELLHRVPGSHKRRLRGTRLSGPGNLAISSCLM
jgi:hypothetical protein